jgi:di/tricarboxylate transporter
MERYTGKSLRLIPTLLDDIFNFSFKDLHTSTGDGSVQVTVVPGDARECPSPQPEEVNDSENLLHFNKDLLNMAAMMTLATSYACNIGGTATLIGTNPNMLLQNLMDE